MAVTKKKAKRGEWWVIITKDGDLFSNCYASSADASEGVIEYGDRVARVIEAPAKARKGKKR